MSPEARAWPRSVARVAEALAARGHPLSLRHVPEGAHTAEAAARAVGGGLAQIVKSLLFAAGETPLLLLVSGANRVDTAALSARLGSPVRRLDAEAVRRITGFAIGGVAPVGHPAPLRTFIDTTLAAVSPLFAAAGAPDWLFATDYAALCRLVGPWAPLAPGEGLIAVSK
jgi:prolyl-tRNA editing enzyme YbaK/EbsC (Cys-tRNA(Pro) deacylase)